MYRKTFLASPRGSSPLARGLHQELVAAAPDPRIIPARAGFTRSLARLGILRGDHPRSRGVYPVVFINSYDANGSSPLARGLRDTGSGRRPCRGIIPARAGFTCGPGPCPRPSPDHPRSRGVYGRYARPDRDRWGSSPLARGLPAAPGLQDGDGRIIPARAGFTGLRGRPGPGGRDHPRSRGVYSLLRVRP